MSEEFVNDKVEHANNKVIKAALIGAAATIVASLITGIFTHNAAAKSSFKDGHDKGYEVGYSTAIQKLEEKPPIDTEEFYTSGYDKGWEDAKAQLNEDEIYQDGYTKGLEDAAEQINTDEIYQNGYKKGVEDTTSQIAANNLSGEQHSDPIDDGKEFVFLHEIDRLKGDDIWIGSNEIDNFGNEHTNVIATQRINNYYNVENKYTRFTATIFQSYEKRDYSNGEIVVILYADDKELEKFSIRASGNPIKPIKIDVNIPPQTEVLRIDFYNYMHNIGFISECKLWK